MKFGGTSVSTRDRWLTIADVIRRKLDKGLRPVLVCSALSGVSDSLEELLRTAVRGDFEKVIDGIERRHLDFAGELGLDGDGGSKPWLDRLRRLATGISLVGEYTPRIQAQVMACGELMSTVMGASFLERCGLSVKWWDARKLLSARNTGMEIRDYLSATCSFEPDEELQELFGKEEVEVHLTQGFIASNPKGDTVLLGRGGSDTSAAYLAAKLQADKLEIWTDVPGMYTADPRLIPAARMLRVLDYREAQELAGLGAKVLHPRCLEPVQSAGIPLEIRCTMAPELGGTRIGAHVPDRGQVKAVVSKRGVILISAETLGMWQEVGFLARLFSCYQRHGLSIDLVATSETNVTVTLDMKANALEQGRIDALLNDLAEFCRPRAVFPCATVSLVGSRIRSILHRLAPALEQFEEERVHLVSQASSDLNITFVVDDDQVERLIKRLHSLLFSMSAGDGIFGAAWDEQFGTGQRITPMQEWWFKKREDLLQLAASTTPLYVYHRESLVEAARSLQNLNSIKRVLYAVKANPNKEILMQFHELGLGFECVSPGEIKLLFDNIPDLDSKQVLYTPNFASRQDYEIGFEYGVWVTLDNIQPLELWPELFAGREIFLRLDPPVGGGHHRHVRTAGPMSKFGISSDDLERLELVLNKVGVRVVGLHAHGGSGIKGIERWYKTAVFLAEAANVFPGVRILDLGGGLAVPERIGDKPIDLRALDDSLTRFLTAHPSFELWVEPGRFLVAGAGVLLTKVNQTKRKGLRRYVGVDAGMNCLIRPALYGAYHPIVNLTRLEEEASVLVDVVGPICETGDFLGLDRRLPVCSTGDVMLVACTGAYGRAMSSDYNLRSRGDEIVI